MIETFFQAIYFILPAYVANMFPVILGACKFPFGIPISEKHFGKNKTYRGFYAGYFGALLMLYCQKYLINLDSLNLLDSQATQISEPITILNYSEINIFFYAFLFGFGAILGDTVKSFFKRKLNKKSGSSWVPFDQLDFILGSLFFLIPFQFLDFSQSDFLQNLEISHYLILLFFTPIFHLISNIIAYWLGIKKVWW